MDDIKFFQNYNGLTLEKEIREYAQKHNLDIMSTSLAMSGGFFALVVFRKKPSVGSKKKSAE